MQTFAENALPEKAARIVEAAVDAIAEKGLDQVKLTDVARKAGVTTGAVTYYFEDKDALLVAAFHASCGAHLEEMKKVGGAPVDGFLRGLPTTPKQRRQWSVWLAFCVRAQTSNKMNRIYRDHYAAAEATVAEIIGVQHTDGGMDLAGRIIAAMDGVGLAATLNPQQWPAERQRDALRSLLEPIFLEHHIASTD